MWISYLTIFIISIFHAKFEHIFYMFDCLYLWFGGGLIDVTNAKIFFFFVVRYFRLLGFKIENNPWIRIHKTFDCTLQALNAKGIKWWQYWLTRYSYFCHEYDHRYNNERLRKFLGVICNLQFLQKKTAWKGWPQNVKGMKWWQYWFKKEILFRSNYLF